jgi:hypothetical protein
MDAHVTEVMTETGLEEGASLAIERLAGTA